MKVKWHTAKYGDPYSEMQRLDGTCGKPRQESLTKVQSGENKSLDKELCSLLWQEESNLPKHTPRAVGSHLCCSVREQLGVRCLAQGHLSRGNEGGESAVHSLPPPIIPAGPRLEPLDYESNSLTIRSRLTLLPRDFIIHVMQRETGNILLHLLGSIQCFCHCLIAQVTYQFRVSLHQTADHSFVFCFLFFLAYAVCKIYQWCCCFW